MTIKIQDFLGKNEVGFVKYIAEAVKKWGDEMKEQGFVPTTDLFYEEVMKDFDGGEVGVQNPNEPADEETERANQPN